MLSSTTNLMRRYTHLGNRVNFTPLSKATKKSNIKYLENQCNLTLQEIEKRDKRKFNLTQQFVKSKENISDFKNSGNLLKKLTHGSVPSSTKKTEGRCLTAVSRSGWDFQQKSRLKLFRTKETDDFVADLINI